MLGDEPADEPADEHADEPEAQCCDPRDEEARHGRLSGQAVDDDAGVVCSADAAVWCDGIQLAQDLANAAVRALCLERCRPLRWELATWRDATLARVGKACSG